MSTMASSGSEQTHHVRVKLHKTLFEDCVPVGVEVSREGTFLIDHNLSENL